MQTIFHFSINHVYYIDYSIKLFIPFLNEFCLTLICILFLLACCFYKSIYWTNYYMHLYTQWLVQILGLLCFNNFIVLNLTIIRAYGFYFNKQLEISYVTLNIQALILLISFVIFVQYKFFVLKNKKKINAVNEFSFLFLGTLLFLLLLLSTCDLILTTLSIISMSICFYALSALNCCFGTIAREATMKYFILSALSTGLILGGTKELFLHCGTVNYTLLNDYFLYLLTANATFNQLFFIKTSIILIFIGFTFKLSAAPSHFWAPEVYEGSPYALILFIILPIKIAITTIIIKLIQNVFILQNLPYYLNFKFLYEIHFVISIVIILSIFIGGINAFFEENLKRFFAYSSINQIGFLLIGVLGINSSLFGLQAYFYFLFVYALNLMFLFCYFFYCNQKWKIELFFIPDINQLFFLPFLRLDNIFFFLIILSLAGIPPLPGFYSKFYIILYAFNAHYSFICALSILFSIFSAYYYLKFLKFFFN